MTSAVVTPLMPQPLLRPAPLAQYVPSRACASCDVCCRFPEHDSFLRPYFTADEARAAIARGVSAEAFPEPAGGQVRLVPNQAGDGYLCPAFDPVGNRCTIYEDRPLDCQLYPLALMWDAAGQQVVLGWDAKCPYVLEATAGGSSGAALAAYAAEVAVRVESEPRLGVLARNPRLITRYQDDVVVLRALSVVTARVRGEAETGVAAPLTPGDRNRFEAAAARVPVRAEDCPSAWAFANHYLWRDLLAFSWMEIGGCFCLFAETADGTFMPVPPLGDRVEDDVLARVFAYMRAHSRGEGVARIENVPQGAAEDWQRRGYRMAPRDPEYLYETEALAALRGDPYKSQRAACNRLLRRHHVALEPYGASHREACGRLYEDWREQKRQDDPRDWGALLLEDSRSFHQRLLVEAPALGLAGLVARVDGRVCAYSFGTMLRPGVWCVLAEVADRVVSGLAEYIFRESTRRAAAMGCSFVNTMDAMGLPLLAQSKQAYHPVRLVQPFTVYER